MFKRKTKPPSTRELLRADYDFSKNRGSWWYWMFAIVIMMILGLPLACYFASSKKDENIHRTLLEENEKLKWKISEETMKMQQDMAVREELMRQIKEQSNEIKELQNKLAFVGVMKKK